MNKILTKVGVVIALFLGVIGILNDSKEVIKETTIQAGAVSSPDILSPYFSYGGVRHWAGKQTLNTATTTPCAIQSPVATSTLSRVIFNVNVSTSTAATMTLATSSTAFATSTELFRFTIPANLTRTFQYVASTTDAQGQAQTIAPNTYLVFGAAGVASGGFTFGGSCSAVFTEV